MPVSAMPCLAARVYIYPGASIGQEGFSFAETKPDPEHPQLGRVIVGDDVEVGANPHRPRINSRHGHRRRTRIDNLVQIGHNVRVGRCCVIVAQVGIAGSTTLEDFVQVGGQAAMARPFRIGHGTQIGAQAGVISDVPACRDVAGKPGTARKEFFRQIATLKRITRRPG